jgi:hypothetical protein
MDTKQIRSTLLWLSREFRTYHCSLSSLSWFAFPLEAREISHGKEETFRAANIMSFVSVHLAYRIERITDKLPRHGDMLTAKTVYRLSYMLHRLYFSLWLYTYRHMFSHRFHVIVSITSTGNDVIFLSCNICTMLLYFLLFLKKLLIAGLTTFTQTSVYNNYLWVDKLSLYRSNPWTFRKISLTLSRAFSALEEIIRERD